jgi:hypothetical protein
MKPFVIKNFFDVKMIKLLQFQVDLLKKSNIQRDDSVFHRKQVHNHPLLKVLHEQMTEEANLLFSEKLKPSYVFLSMYFEGQGQCPIHVDRPQCYRTIDVCLNQKKVWPIYVNHEHEYDEKNIGLIKVHATAYELEIGDAVCYSGTHHPHFRNGSDSDNFCDLAFFHFVQEDFQGDLN